MLKMQIFLKVFCILVAINGNGICGSDNVQKELTIRSIEGNSKSSDQPFRVNLTSFLNYYELALNVLPIDTKAVLEDKSSNDANVKVIGDVIESQTSKNIQAAGKLTTTSSPKLRKEKSDPYECPNTSEFSFFPHYCSRHANCLSIGKEYRCCRQFNSKRCVKGVPKPLKEQRHEPILGLIPRKCPKEPLAELFWELKTCNTDHDCWPRICCPDGTNKYCRSARPELENVPVGKQLAYPIDMLSSYLKCTPAPPTAYDLHPKPCNNTLDCFPNVCCQEEGRKYCRPPKKSLLAFITNFAQRFNTGVVRQWTDNIVFNR
ncbi:uncharacterized protein LOC129579016 isoform X1 [Sitodiplosis mosellana]|uniref:uncharacterized protein LOC129579016 isoform X1 n=1 Tax=Sitodiplosis mosellana TaxID=263140 RepID=UPI002443E75F|nr:uncharacterized protein LOC129579016 isoform X1 [Sitodiplosis mosellana]